MIAALCTEKTQRQALDSAGSSGRLRCTGRGESASIEQGEVRMALPRTADIVVVGGGVIGASIAFHLARKKVGKVVLLERKHLASGSTGTSSGLVIVL